MCILVCSTMTDCHIALYKKYNSLNGLHTKEMDKYKIIIEEHHIAAHTPKKDKKIRIGYILKSADVGTLFSRRNSENSGKFIPHTCIPAHTHPHAN